jgi:hypothetical protein
MKRWNVAAVALALLLVFALGKWYRPLLGDVRLGAAVDLVLFVLLFAGCRHGLRKLTDGLDD